MTTYPSDGGMLTGTPDKDYNILWFTETCPKNVLRLDQYIADAVDANDQGLAEFFQPLRHTCGSRVGRAERARGRPDPSTEPPPKSEEDLQPKDPSEMPLEAQDPVQPPDRAS